MQSVSRKKLLLGGKKQDKGDDNMRAFFKTDILTFHSRENTGVTHSIKDGCIATCTSHCAPGAAER